MSPTEVFHHAMQDYHGIWPPQLIVVSASFLRLVKDCGEEDYWKFVTGHLLLVIRPYPPVPYFIIFRR